MIYTDHSGLDGVPTPVASGVDAKGKELTRGLEQRYYEADLKANGNDKTKVANKQNPVGENNKRRDDYLKAADEHLNNENKNKASSLCNNK